MLSTVIGQALLPYHMQVNKPAPASGYYFLFTYRMHKTAMPTAGQQMIIDGNGNTVYYRITDKASDFKMHANGWMSYFNNGKFYLLNSRFEVFDSVACVNGIETDPHDFQILPNGNFLLLGLESDSVNLSGYNIFMQQTKPGARKGILKYGVVQQLDRNKKLVCEWRAKPYFKLEDCDRVFLNDTNSVDVTHFNSVAKNKKGEFLLSARYTHEVLLITKAGQISWRLGGVHNQFNFVNDTLNFLGQHDARFAAAHCITLFDNGYARDPYKHTARALKYRVNSRRKTARLVWHYNNPQTIISEATGNAQWHRNGNVLLNYGRISDNSYNITLEEVNAAGKQVVSLYFEDTVGSYRAFHYKKVPFKLPRPVIKIKRDNKYCILKTAETYSSYKWSNGETNDSIQITQPGKYYVYVPIGNGGFIMSKPVNVGHNILKGKAALR